MPEALFGRDEWKSTETERDFQCRVTELMVYHGWRVFSIPDSRRATVSGFPDICAWSPKHDILVFIELKREKGRLSASQIQTLGELSRVAPTFVFRPSDWDDVLELSRGKLPKGEK